MIYVLAGTEQEYRLFCREEGLNPKRRPPTARRIIDERGLLGIRLAPDDSIKILPLWWERADPHLAEVMLARIKMLEALQ